QVQVNSQMAVPDVVINEFLASNNSGLVDQDGDRGDWIEIRNRGQQAVNLSGWSLSDDQDNPGQWSFPPVTLQAGGYLIVFASGKDRAPTSGQLHANFQLSRSGEFLGLFNHELPRVLVDA